jgi:hypothetical protein
VDELRTTLAAFRSGNASVATLVAAFDRALQTDVAACQQVLIELESSRWLSLQLLPLLESSVPQAISSQAPQPPRGPPDNGETREPASAEGTVFVGHARPAINEPAKERRDGDRAAKSGSVEVIDPAPSAEGELAQAGETTESVGGHGRRSAARCHDIINGERSPPVVIVPAGGGSPPAFAITRYKVGDDAGKWAVTIRRPHSGSVGRNTGSRLVRDIKG